MLNKALQDRINPPAKLKKEKEAHGTVFREGDRVMQITNDYEIEWEKNGATGLGIFNGDIGVIQTINRNEETMDIWFDDRLVHYEFDKLEELELAYAITVHKSQGSEYPVVFLPPDAPHPKPSLYRRHPSKENGHSRRQKCYPRENGCKQPRGASLHHPCT